MARVARLNAATVVSLAAAPPPPDSVILRRESSTSGGQAWTITWRSARGASAYELLVRRTTSPTWESVIPVVGTSYTLAFQLDDGWVAVRSVGPTGHRSLARAAGPAPRAPARPAR